MPPAAPPPPRRYFQFTPFRILWIGMALGGLLVGLVFLILLGQSGRPPEKAAAAPAEPVFVLTNQLGERLSSTSLKGRIQVVSFISPYCREECPLIALAVVESGQLVGIFSERDYARKVVLQGLTSKTTRVRALMSPNPITAAPGTSIADCMRLMIEHRIRHLPILEAGQLAGLVSIGDIVKGLLAEQEALIGDLRDYIGGKS